jgi:hypothetical protein
VAPPLEQVTDGTAMSEAAMDRWQAAAIIVVTLVVTVLIYVSRF